MGEILTLAAPRQLAFETYPEPELEPGQVRIQTLYSGISAGTEMTQYRGTNPYLQKQWDASFRLFRPSNKPSLQYPVTTWGYEQVGRVIEVGAGVTGVENGSLVFGTWGHRSTCVVAAEYVRDRLMPPGLDPILGIFSHLGAIALNGTHDSQIRIGETAAVFGLGALGQIVAQAARQSGARVIGVDLLEARLGMATQLGAHQVLNAREPVAEIIKEQTGGRGADVCFEVSGSTRALNEAIRTAAYSARVVALGFYQGEAQGLLLGEEFHHNRINLVCSQIGGTAPEVSYRWNKLRLWQTAIRLQAEGVLNLKPLITHMAPFREAAAFFDLLDRNPDRMVQAVLEFPR